MTTVIENRIQRPEAITAPADQPVDRGGRLTLRDIETIRLVADGLTNAEIAAELYLSHCTVKGRIVDVLRKLNARNRAHLVTRAFEIGLLTPPQRRPR